MQARGRLIAPGKDEALQRLEPFVDEIAELFEPLHLSLADAQTLALVLERHAKIGAEVEEIVLDSSSHGRISSARPPRARTDERVELVDRPIRLDARIGLRHARAVAEARLPGVATARVDAREAHRLVQATHAPPWPAREDRASRAR